MTTYTVKNISTGFLFDLSKEDCDKLVLEEPFNFVVLDKNYVSPIQAAVKQKDTYKKVVVDDEPKAIEDYSDSELKEYLTKNNIKFKSSAKKYELLELALKVGTNEPDLREKADKYGVVYTDETSDSELETAIIEKLVSIAKEKDIDMTQNPVSIDYLEDLLKDNEE